MNVLNQTALAVNAQEIADAEHLEEEDRSCGGSAIAGPIAVANLVADEVTGDEFIDFAQEVVLGDESLEGRTFSISNAGVRIF